MVDAQPDRDLDEFIADIVVRVAAEDRDGVRGLLEGMHPADIAALLREIEEGRAFILGVLDPETASEVLSETGEDFRSDLLEGLDERRIRRIFHEMSDDDAADIVGELTDEETERVLGLIKREDQEEIQALLGYDEETAGGNMTTELVSVEERLDVASAMEAIRRRAHEVDEFFNVYVTDAAGALRGMVTLRDLILADPSSPISSVMQSEVTTVPPEMDQEDVARIMSRYNLVAIPVVDGANGRLLGRVTVDDILDVVEAEVTEDLLRMGGADEEEEIYGGAGEAVRFRLPWLLLNLVTAFVAASVVGYFRDTIHAVVMLAIFMPVIAGMGGNAATQSLAVTLRRLTLGDLTAGAKLRILRKEFLAGLTNGLLLGLVVATAALGLAILLGESPILGLVAGLAMFLEIGLAGLVGSLIPIALCDRGIDPAVASSVFITTVTDLVGFFLLLGLGTLLLAYLV